MDDLGKNRIDLWLFVAAATVFFRVMMFIVEIVTLTVGIALARIPYEMIPSVIAALPVLGPVLAVVLAVLLARAVESRLLGIQVTTKKVLLVVLALLALLPWRLQVKMTARPLTWDEVPEHVKKAMGLQQQGGEYSPTAVPSSQTSP